ncbi:MAG: hypothetical protein L6Q97_03765 [Thermoanaerobaculia bacterium]|nr:hypothetical protein [Thermoanaerobaculia bacterium]
MTPALRKTHRYAWYALAILLPMGWLAAIRAIPGEIRQQPVRREQALALPVLAQSRQSGDLLINLRQDSSGTKRQLEIFIQKPLSNPNTLVILENQHAEQLIGLLGTRGVWRFDLDSLTVPIKLRLEDKIHNRVLQKLTLE